MTPISDLRCSMTFLHISPDPKSCDDNIPVTPFGQVLDILFSARYILRRRNADEVRERATIILGRISKCAEDLIETCRELGESTPLYLDEAALLQNTIMPHRAYQFRSPENRDDINIPVVVEEGWIEAEDFAVLALITVDDSISARQDESPEHLNDSAELLLRAYRCLLFAERAKGSRILTVDEYDQFKQNYLELRKQRKSEKNSEAKKFRATETLKAHVLECYRQMRQDRPNEQRKVLAAEIADNYIESLPTLTKMDCKLSPTNATRTIRDWIKREGDLPKAEPVHPDPYHQIRINLRNKNQKKA